MFLCDTNILAELTRPQPNPGVVMWASGVSRLSVSVVTVEEVFFGLSFRPNPRILSWFEAFLADQCQVIGISNAVARRAGELRGTLRRQGQVRTQADMLIAATASVHALTLVTRNERDFVGCGIPVLNPFT
jgi:predicted nucleic acid-binding protein